MDEKKDDHDALDGRHDQGIKSHSSGKPPTGLGLSLSGSRERDCSSRQSGAKPHAPSKSLLHLLIVLLLLTVSTLFVLAYCMRHIHNNYYKVLIDRAERTDDQLLEEFTYYKRDCNAYDVTTHKLSELSFDVNSGIEGNLNRFLTHGAMVFPEILTLAEAEELRQYIQRRNSEVSEAEEYPVSQGEHRISYGIEPTEHPAVARAVKRITTDPMFRQMITNILGDPDPASAEITAITNYYGCPYQVWHSDTKADGNALFYSRTYAHSYSLFVPLQNTTEAMGITDLVPGSQYCGNDIQALCENHGISLSQALPDGVFPAGSGALLNQHIWHRGGAHTDPTAPERIVFILSFLSRPKSHDPRMLARGTYFHQKWTMWGMTYRDLMDPYKTMGKPWSILRCLSIWKPTDRNWGWDLVTSGYLRFSNGQLQDDDFYDRFLPRLEELHFPSWLRGEVLLDDAQKQVWSHFIHTTIDNVFTFATNCVVAVHAALATIGVCFMLGRKGIDRLPAAARLWRQILLMYGMFAAATFLTLRRIDASSWGQSVSRGAIWKRPFSSEVIVRSDESVMLSPGRTTCPTREDILMGSRFDAKFLGSYDRWLDFHSGNARFRSEVVAFAQLYSVLSSDVSRGFRELVFRSMKAFSTGNEGRFLEQDFRTGDWRLMSELEINDAVHAALISESSEHTGRLVKEIDYVIAHFRFGSFRDTRLASLTRLHFWHLKRRILGLPHRIRDDTATEAYLTTTAFTASARALYVPLGSRIKFIRRKEEAFTVDRGVFQAGSLVWTYFENDFIQGWYPATVLAVEPRGKYLVSYDGGADELVEKERIHKRLPLLEGDRVMGCSQPGLEECFPGTIRRVMPNQDIAIAYDNGQLAERVSPFFYYQPPYKHLSSFDDEDYFDDEDGDEEDDDDAYVDEEDADLE